MPDDTEIDLSEFVEFYEAVKEDLHRLRIEFQAERAYRH